MFGTFAFKVHQQYKKKVKLFSGQWLKKNLKQNNNNNKKILEAQEKDEENSNTSDRSVSISEI